MWLILSIKAQLLRNSRNNSYNQKTEANALALVFHLLKCMQRRTHMQSMLLYIRFTDLQVGVEDDSRQSFSIQASTLVLAEHEGGSIKASSVSAVAAASSLSKDNSISVLLSGLGPSLQEAASHAASCHPAVSQVA